MARLFIVVVATFFRLVLGQVTHTVHVGAEGSFYNPPTVSAAVNDTITFVFFGPIHSVIQTSFDNPCFPLPGGFSSGIVQHTNDSLPMPTWNLEITNVSQGIWFYCGNTVPVSHCASGMVGAINPPSIAQYEQFLAAAKLTTPPEISPSLALTGQGAVATDPPAIPTSTTLTTTTPPLRSSEASSVTGSTTLTPTSTPTSTSTPAPTPTSTTPSSSRKNAILGGSIGGGLAFLIILALLYFIWCRFRRHRRRGSKDFFRYKAQSPRLGTPPDAFMSARLIASPADRFRQAQLSVSNPSSTTSSPAPLVPQRLQHSASHSGNLGNGTDDREGTAGGLGTSRDPFPKMDVPRPPPPPPPPSSDTQPLVDLKHPIPTTSTSVVPPVPEQDSGQANIQHLAREVAAVLMQNPLGARGRPAARGSSSRSSVIGETAVPPPRYRATVV